MSDYVQVLTTEDSEENAASLARDVLELRLAACVQIVGPIRSMYWWQDTIEDASEWLLLIKTTAERTGELERHIKANHSYDVPEIIVTPILGGNAEYLWFVSKETSQSG